MSLGKEDRWALIDFRLEKSENAVADFELLAANERWAAAANRMYYAAYYAVSALLIACRFTSKTHEGIIRIFSKEFVLSGKIDTRLGRVYSDLYTKRITGDYGDSFNVQAEDILPLIEPTKELIARVREEIAKINTNNN